MINIIYSMPKRQKSESCSSGWCKNHLFELIPLRSNLYYKKKEKIRLCPKLNKNTNSFQKSVPLLNRDHRHYTPSFILEEEEAFYHENDQRMLSNHLERVESMESGATCTILIAKHGRKRKYCAVCQDDYDDYLEHIKAPLHKDKIMKNKASGYMNQLCSRYKIVKEPPMQSRTTEETCECNIKQSGTKEVQEEVQMQEEHSLLKPQPL